MLGQLWEPLSAPAVRKQGLERVLRTRKLFVGGQTRVRAAQHYHCRAVIRGFLTGRSARIKWVKRVFESLLRAVLER